MDPITPAAEETAPRRLAAAAGLVALLLCALMAYWLWVLRDHRTQFTSRQLVLQTAALSEHARVVFDTVDASLQAAAVDLREGRITPQSAHANLSLRAGDDLYVHELDLVADDGTVVASSSEHPLLRQRAKTPAAASAGLSITATPGDDALELSRSVPGTTVAEVVAVVDKRFIARFFARVAIANDARFGLYALDGTRLAGDLDLPAMQNAGETPAATLQRLLDPGAPIEHSQLFASAQRLRDVPLVAVTSRDRSAVLAPWLEYLGSASVITVIALGLLVFVVRRLQHEMRARVEAQKALARRAEQTRRLEALGRLSGGIAHDFNNVLAAILGYADLLEQQVPAGTPAARSAEQVLRAGERGKRLVARILSFSRGGTRPQAPVSAQAVVGEVLDLLAATLPATVKVERSFDALDALVRGDATQLFEAVHNLCTNALHAMQGGGVLRVSLTTRLAPIAQTYSHGRLDAGEQVVLCVEDSGPGIAPEAVEHLFEPFFTTRAAEGGTGLGLAMVHGAVKDMEGAVDVQSTPGKGARFTLAFPRLHAAAPAEENPVTVAPRGAGQVVMVVDDEPALVTLTEEVLAGMGYEPAGFRDPIVALAALRATPERFDALLVDQVMPGLPGTELARQFRALRPQAPILLVSGFGGANLEARARDAGVSLLLQKPLQRGELGERLAHAFGAH